jgi:hypothetical protein
MADDRDENFLLLEMEQMTEQLKKLVTVMNHIDSKLHIIADRMLRLGK